MKDQEVIASNNAIENQSNNLESEIEALRNQIMPGARDGDLKLFTMFCKKTQLDPFSRQIYAINRGGKWTYQTSIDGFRVVAERSGLYQGQTAPLWCGKDGVWKDVWLDSNPPAAAKVGVYKKGHQEPIYAVAIFSSYAQSYNGKLGGLWKKMPEVMISKCAESLALRKAFPNDLSGLYTGDEMAQANNQEQSVNKSMANKTIETKATNVNSERKQVITDDQVKRLHTLKTNANVSDEDLKIFLDKMGISSSKLLTIPEYKILCSSLEKKIESINQALNDAVEDSSSPSQGEAPFDSDDIPF